MGVSDPDLIKGTLVELDKTRRVFVGMAPDDGSVYIGFRNKVGEDTKIILSAEAADALKFALTMPRKDETYPLARNSQRWVAVVKNTKEHFDVE